MSDSTTVPNDDHDHDQLELTLHQWVAAELHGDTDRLDTLLADDFTGVGPLGFTLTKPEWLDRHRQHALSYTRFALNERTVRHFDACAVVLARQDVEGAWQGHPVPTALRTTIVLTLVDGSWRLAVAHTSFVAGTAGAPQIPR
jgi:ketosteroid isomerase-like protein